MTTTTAYGLSLVLLVCGSLALGFGKKESKEGEEDQSCVEPPGQP